MNKVQYRPIEGFAPSPAFSEIAILPAQACLVVVGGQNAVSEDRQLVGKADPVLQAETIKKRLEAALQTAGCGWEDVFRVTIALVGSVDPRSVFSVFVPVLSLRPSPPLVSVSRVEALANPDFLVEIGLEAVKP